MFDGFLTCGHDRPHRVETRIINSEIYRYIKLVNTEMEHNSAVVKGAETRSRSLFRGYSGDNLEGYPESESR